ncbi:hypothetical protein [Klebsiella variicola]|uniref:hypothetical protein n=1 Tax=Klebsiella variicola TaxID=244366 RepID=UPI000667A801|nr:hypothetical protein [Klebsiella variicola]
MHNHTNVVPQVETDFITTARDLMTDRSKAVSLFTWPSEAIVNNKHSDELIQLIGYLINENFALDVQLKGRAQAK